MADATNERIPAVVRLLTRGPYGPSVSWRKEQFDGTARYRGNDDDRIRGEDRDRRARRRGRRDDRWQDRSTAGRTEPRLP